MLQKTRGIVLHHIKYSESSIIVYIYTEKFGRQAYILNNVHGKRTTSRVNVLQPLFILELEVYYKPQRDLQRIKEFRNILPFKTIPHDLIKSSIVLFLAEILYRTLREEESNPTLFDFLINSFQLFDKSLEGILNFHILFLLHFTKYLGFYPNNNFSVNNKYFDLRKGYFVSSKPSHHYHLESSTRLIFSKLLTRRFEKFNLTDIPVSKRGQILEKILEYYQLHVEGLGMVKSLKVMKEVFHQIT
jgi:DNA repair protein RecO (recombination protein O)